MRYIPIYILIFLAVFFLNTSLTMDVVIHCIKTLPDVYKINSLHVIERDKLWVYRI